MRQKSGPQGRSNSIDAEQHIKTIRRAPRKKYSTEEKIRVVMSGLRGEYSVAELCRREGIAAYVSGLNSCSFCFGAHKLYAEVFGFDPELVEQMVDNLEKAPIDVKLKPLLRYAAKLKDLPPKLTQGDADAVYKVGWSEDALFHTIEIAALFNYMNRIIEGAGVLYNFADNPPSDDEKAQRRTRTYSDFGRMIGID